MCLSRWNLQSFMKTTVLSILETMLFLTENLKMVLSSDTNISSFSIYPETHFLCSFLFYGSLSTNWRTTDFLFLPNGSSPVDLAHGGSFPLKTSVKPPKLSRSKIPHHICMHLWYVCELILLSAKSSLVFCPCPQLPPLPTLCTPC